MELNLKQKLQEQEEFLKREEAKFMQLDKMRNELLTTLVTAKAKLDTLRELYRESQMEEKTAAGSEDKPNIVSGDEDKTEDEN